MLPLYLVTDHGMKRNWANTLIALSRIAAVATTLVGGWATDRIGPKQLAQPLIRSETGNAERTCDGEGDDDRKGDQGCSNRQQSDALESKSK